MAVEIAQLWAKVDIKGNGTVEIPKEGIEVEVKTRVDSWGELRELYEQTGSEVPQWLLDKLSPKGVDIDPVELMHLAIGAGIPPKYANLLPDSSRVDAMREGTSYYVFGTSGDGKTTKSAELAIGWIAAGGDAVWVDALDLLSELRDTYGGGGSEMAVVRRYTGCGLLVIDDLGKGTYGRWAVSKLFQILNARYGAAKTDLTEVRPTIITSQYRLGELAQVMSSEDPHGAQAIAGRIQEKYRGIDCGPKDRRLG